MGEGVENKAGLKGTANGWEQHGWKASGRNIWGQSDRAKLIPDTSLTFCHNCGEQCFDAKQEIDAFNVTMMGGVPCGET